MEKFIEVTNALTKKKTLINVSNVITIDEKEDGTATVTINLTALRNSFRDITIPTEESYAEVVDKITCKRSPYGERGSRFNGFEIIIKASELKVDIEATFKELDVDIGAYILHDKDNKEPHYHIIVPTNFGGIRLPDLVTAFCLTNDNCVTYLKGFADDISNYLIHNKPNLKDRYQYSATDIHYYEK